MRLDLVHTWPLERGWCEKRARVRQIRLLSHKIWCKPPSFHRHNCAANWGLLLWCSFALESACCHQCSFWWTHGRVQFNRVSLFKENDGLLNFQVDGGMPLTNTVEEGNMSVFLWVAVFLYYEKRWSSSFQVDKRPEFVSFSVLETNKLSVFWRHGDDLYSANTKLGSKYRP